jgi:hypothetical protein
LCSCAASSEKISHAAEFYAAAKANISNPPHPEHTELAIKQNAGGLTVFSSGSLADSVRCPA